MPVSLNIGNMKYRENSNDSWHPLMIGTDAVMTSLAGAYDSTATYAVGDYCTLSGQLYRCITAIQSGETWTASHWTAVTVMDEVTQYIVTPATGVSF